MSDVLHLKTEIVASGGANVTYAGALSSLFSWGLKLPETVAILSFLVALAGLCLQAYYISLMARSLRDRSGSRPAERTDKPPAG
jgi:uncharacterized membrane protein YhaH (DUF805 family)